VCVLLSEPKVSVVEHSEKEVSTKINMPPSAFIMTKECDGWKRNKCCVLMYSEGMFCD
jgi:hypothetical protein